MPNPNQIRIPENIIQQIIFWAESEGLGVSQLGNEDVCLLSIGRSELGANTASLIAAHILIGGVLSDAWNAANEAALENSTVPKEKM